MNPLDLFEHCSAWLVSLFCFASISQWCFKDMANMGVAKRRAFTDGAFYSYLVRRTNSFEKQRTRMIAGVFHGQLWRAFLYITQLFSDFVLAFFCAVTACLFASGLDYHLALEGVSL